jgi:hypothetical protein
MHPTLIGAWGRSAADATHAVLLPQRNPDHHIVRHRTANARSSSCRNRTGCASPVMRSMYRSPTSQR